MRAASGLYVLRRLLAGEDASGLIVSDSDPLKTIVERVRNANGEGPLGAFRSALEGVPGAEEIVARVLSGDPTADSPSPRRSRISTVPELPSPARPDASIAADAGSWIDSYVQYGHSVSPMTPSIFHEATGLVISSTAIARRLHVSMPHDEVFPNLYVLEIAPSTIFAKSTGINVGRRLAEQKIPFLLAPQESTPEALMSDMAGREPTHFDKLTVEDQHIWRDERDWCAQRTLIIDEGSGLLALCAKDYGSGLTEFLLKLYDCNPRYSRSTRSQGRLTIRNAYFNLLTASTPSAMAPYLGPEKLWSDGLWPRFALLSPEGGRPPFQRAKPVGPPGAHIWEPISRLWERLPGQTYPSVAQPVDVPFNRAALQKWHAYDEALRYTLIADDTDERVRTSYGRMPTHVLKVATLLAAMDWPASDPNPRIGLPQIHRAIAIVERWRASLHRVLEGGAVAEENVKLSRVIRQVSLAGLGGISARDVCRAMRDLPGSEVRKLLDQAVSTDEIEAIQVKAGLSGGRPTMHFRIPLD